MGLWLHALSPVDNKVKNKTHTQEREEGRGRDRQTEMKGGDLVGREGLV